MQITKVIVGPIETNCYLLEKENQVLVIDPGEEAEKIKRIIGKKQVVGIVITHYHFDHIGALETLKETYSVPVYDIHTLKEGENQIGPFPFEMILTPGHKEDLITLYFKDEQVMFVGDFIFKGSIGRIDLPGGDWKEMETSIEKIKKYPKEITIYPGHGDETTLAYEIAYNPYF